MRERVRPIERGQSITFRVPSDTPDYLLKQLQYLRETERRNFSSSIAQFVLKGVNETVAKKRETVTIPLPKALTKEQKNWLKHEHSEALLGTIVYQLLQDPVRATALLASFTGNYDNSEPILSMGYTKQESYEASLGVDEETEEELLGHADTLEVSDDLSLDSLRLDHLLEDIHSSDEALENEEEEDPLGDFFSSMNK